MDYRFKPHELVQDSRVFGDALLRVRRELDVSRKGLADHALIATSTIATYETGARDPSVEAIVGIAVACGVEAWSAAQHGHLLLANRAMRLDPAGVPLLFIPPLGSGRSLPVGRQAAPIGTALASVSVALAGAAVASAVRRRRGEAAPIEVSAKKLIARAEAATPLPGAVEFGLYPLVEPQGRRQLVKALVDRSRNLSEDELTALVAALGPDVSQPGEYEVDK